MVLAVVALLVLAMVVLALLPGWLSDRRAAPVEILYRDTAAEEPGSLVSHRYGLAGKPDSVLRLA